MSHRVKKSTAALEFMLSGKKHPYFKHAQRPLYRLIGARRGTNKMQEDIYIVDKHAYNIQEHVERFFNRGCTELYPRLVWQFPFKSRSNTDVALITWHQ